VYEAEKMKLCDEKSDRSTTVLGGLTVLLGFTPSSKKKERE